MENVEIGDIERNRTTKLDFSCKKHYVSFPV